MFTLATGPTIVTTMQVMVHRIVHAIEKVRLIAGVNRPSERTHTMSDT